MPIRVARAGEQLGIWEVNELQALVNRGDVLRTDLVWTKGLLEWKPLADAWAEVGIAPPIPAGEPAPPIPGSYPPPLEPSTSPRRTPITRAASKADLSDVAFRRQPTRRYGYSPGTKVFFVFALLVGGWLTVNYGLPWVNQRLAANFESGRSTATASNARAADSGSGNHRPTSEPNAAYSDTPRHANSAPVSNAGSGGMSRSAVAECEKHTAKFTVTRQVYTNMAQFLGPQAAVDKLIEKLKGEGLSDECIAYLNANI